jgi:hypothetical protein
MKKEFLNNDQKKKLQQVLDYKFNLDSPHERKATQALISQDPQAKQLHQKLEQTLSPLNILQDEPVPTGLSQRTLEMIAQHRQAQSLAISSAAIAGQVPKRESRTRWVLANLREWVAVAASIVLIFYVMQPGLRQVRSQSQQVACLSQLQKVGQSLSSYAAANGGYLPHINFQPGDVWWNVGEKGEQNHSNTRKLYLLIKNRYANPDAFICSGSEKKSPKQIPINDESLQQLRDFICRMHVNYSISLSPKKVHQERPRSSQVIILTDQNPLFVNIDCETPPDNGVVKVDDSLRQANSPNHNQRGQNVLMLDGSARFHASRFVGKDGDDIFTIDKVNRYQGNEMPESSQDIFLAP